MSLDSLRVHRDDFVESVERDVTRQYEQLYRVRSSREQSDGTEVSEEWKRYSNLGMEHGWNCYSPDIVISITEEFPKDIDRHDSQSTVRLNLEDCQDRLI